jgi:2-polyprenyl-6-methoxyphenol hydroxylase-like FAD-dependent oxidoreductase
VLNVKKYDGTLIGSFPVGDPNNPSLAIYRSKLHKVLYEYVSQLGIPVEYSATASDFFEEGDHAGVILSDGRKLTADVVVAADGVGTKSWASVVGSKETPISSGFIMYRVTFSAALALANPVLAKEFEGFKDRSFLHAGPGAHVVTCKSENDICWLLTRRVYLPARQLYASDQILMLIRTTAVMTKKTGLRPRRPTKPLRPSRAGSRS